MSSVRLAITNNTTSTRRRKQLPRSGSGALTISLKQSSRAKARRQVNATLDEPSIQVLNRNNLPLTLALHSDFLEKNHIHQTGIAHKHLIQTAPKRLETRHDKHVIEQWDYQHNRGVPFPEIPLPLTVKRSGDCRHYWATLQTHNQIIKKSTKTINSYLPEHVMAMRRRKSRNRKIILKNFGKNNKKEKKKKIKRARQRRLQENNGDHSDGRRSGSGSGSGSGSDAVKYAKKHQLRPASAQQLRDWSFRENVVATTLQMYAPKKTLTSGISVDDHASRSEPYLKQQGPAGLSVNYLRASLTASPGIPLYKRPKSATPSQRKQLNKNVRPKSAHNRRRKLNPTNAGKRVARGRRPATSNSNISIDDWAHQLGVQEREATGVDFLRDEQGEWRGVKRAAHAASSSAHRSSVDSNQKGVTMYHHTLNTVTAKSPTRRPASAGRPRVQRN